MIVNSNCYSVACCVENIHFFRILSKRRSVVELFETKQKYMSMEKISGTIFRWQKTWLFVMGHSRCKKKSLNHWINWKKLIILSLQLDTRVKPYHAQDESWQKKTMKWAKLLLSSVPFYSFQFKLGATRTDQ